LQKQSDSYDPADGEFMIQESMQNMIKDGHHIYGLEIKGGIYYDTGNPLEYLKTVYNFALKRDDIGPALTEYLRGRLG
jgi:UTP--glucose-1-phosphate uridylyltransferase